MRKHSSSSWAARLVAAALVVSFATQPAHAQFATMDIPHIGVQLAEFATKARQWVEHVKSFSVVREAYAAAQTANTIATNIKGVTDQVRDLTNQGLALQQRIQADLKLVANIRNLRVSNMTDLKNLALNLSNLNFASALPSLGQSMRFTQALADGTDASAEVVKESLTVVSTKAGTRRTATEMRQQQTTAVMSQLALENKAQQDKITQAFQYKKLADELTASAVELQTSTNTANQMSMTDGERVTAQRGVADMLFRATEYREKASTLIASAAQKGPTQLAAEKVLMDEMQVAGLTAMHSAMHNDEDPAY